jgi:hypothetical protein
MTARTKNVVINLTALIGAITTVTLWGAPRVGAFVDQRYVHADSFRLMRLRDSLTHQAEIRDIHRILGRLDSAVRLPQRGR